ncbi:myomegalin isoform X2 [Dendropsophus ebraccatus]|uniref:myomegalin isoform X2 n=1 Tax=Dendropsophus ebraccatus TaxID=150705 RepID=UPI0038311E59
MSIGYRTLSQHLNDLKKENFSLKLRIYFLEERIQHKYEDSSNDVYRSNIELKVEVESLKQELSEKQQLLEKVWADCGNLKSCNDPELHHDYKQRQEEAKHARELLEKKILFLQEEVGLTMEKAEEMSALAESEKENSLKLKKTIEGFTADMTEARLLQKNYCTILAEKDRMIQQMTHLLDNKDSMINQLTQKNQNLLNYQMKDLEKSVQELRDALQQKENEIQNLIEKKGQDATQYETLLAQQASNLQRAQMEAQALQERLQESKLVIKTLQDSQNQLTNKLNSSQELTHNQECLVQSLRDSLQSREHEVMELYQIIDEHNATIAKLQDMLLKCQNDQLQSFQVMPSQLQVLELQNTLFSTQMELQKKQMALRQKERQLTDVKRSQRLLEVDILEGQQQKETTWKHNQELHGALHKLQRELQEKSQHLKNVEDEKCTKLVAQEQNIERLKQTVSQKDQILQEYMDVLHYQQSLEKVPGGNEYMIEKLRQRIKERDAALEKAVDEKFCAVEEKEKEVQRLKIIIREREHDLERLSNVLSGNEETINSLDNLVKAKDMELEQISAAYKNLQWLKQETEEKYRRSLNERESIIIQLQKNLQERNKEIEEIRTCFLGKSDICTSDMIEELKMCLQRKEKMLQDAVFARNQQAEEHMREVMDLLAMISSEKMDQTSVCQNCLLKEQNPGVSPSNENLSNFIHLQKLVQEKEKIIQAFTQSYSVQPISMKSEDLDAKDDGNENSETLRSDLAKAREDLRLVLRKMREYQLEVSALQSIIMKQNEQLREQAADMDTLTRSAQIKEEMIKDLQVKLVDPEDIPTVELLTQQIFTLKENIASLNMASQGHLRHTQKIFKLLEELATNKSRLNEAMQAEKQLYSCIVPFQTENDSFSSTSALHNELLAAQALRGQLEEALMRTMEQLVALQSDSKVPACFGGTSNNKNSAEKRTNQCTEPKGDGSNEKMKEDVQKLKNELQHLISKKNKVEEELHGHKSELKSALKFSALDMRHVTPDLSQQTKFNLSVEKACGTMEQWMGTMEMGEGAEMTREMRKRKAPINSDDKSQNIAGCLERNNNVNSITNTKENKYIEMEAHNAITGQTRETSLKRSLSALNPAKEEFQIPRKTAPGRYYSMDDHRPAASCLSVQNGIQKCPQHVRIDTPPRNRSVSLSESRSGSQLDGPLMKYDTGKVHMDFQDLGYETCGKSENEIDREETTSPECEEDEDMFTEVNPMAEKDSNYQYWAPMTPTKNKANFWQTDQKSEVNVLKQHVKKLKGQLQTSQKLVQHLESRSSPSSKSHSATEEDEGWQSDTTGHHSHSVLEQLTKRVSRLESYLYHLRKDAGTQCHLQPATSPGKYDWLIQEQARELSFLRQKVREGQSVCQALTRHLEEAIKTFEEMLRANDIDYFMGQSFREYLSQGTQLAKKLNTKLNSKGKVNKNQEEESLENRPKLKKDNVMETYQPSSENRSFSPSSSHGSLESDGSILFDDHLSTNDDGCSELSLTSDFSCYEQDSTQGSDVCCNSVYLSNAPHMNTDGRNGLYIVCHADDFNTLKKNLLNGKTLIHNIEARVPFLEAHGGKVMDCGSVSKFFSAIKTLDNVLEESHSVLNLFWTMTQPTQPVNKHQAQEEQMMKDEICTLKNKVKEQELLLQKASAHVKHVNLAKEGMEKLIVKQLTSTCGVLKKARFSLLAKRSNNAFRPSFQLTGNR